MLSSLGLTEVWTFGGLLAAAGGSGGFDVLFMVVISGFLVSEKAGDGGSDDLYMVVIYGFPASERAGEPGSFDDLFMAAISDA